MPVYAAPAESITVSGVAYVPYSGSISGTPLQIAQSFMADQWGDYCFFRYSDADYVLILPDITSTVSVTDSSYVVDGSFSVFEIEYVSGLGQYGSTYTSFYYTPDFEDITILNTGRLLMYSNAEGFPKLHEGGVYYGFAQTAVLCAVCVFLLIGRIFKHVSRV